MRTIGIHTRVASFVGAVALLLQISPALATDHDRDKDRQSTRRNHLHEMGGPGSCVSPASPASCASPAPVLWSLRRLRR